MCTVTFIPSANNFYLTSNRDEHSLRSSAIAPSTYISQNGIQIIYPKDADAGGTWIALSDNNDAAVLLNGAFKNHARKSTYRRSRGLILLDVFTKQNAVNEFFEIDLNDVEPFTIILFINKKLFEGRWNGEQKYFIQLNNKERYIWSSATLYDAAIRSKRQNWFEGWNKNTPYPTQKDILNFHHFSGDGDTENDLVMNRENKITTVSISSVCISPEKSSLQYFDLIANTSFEKQFQTRNYFQAETTINHAGK